MKTDTLYICTTILLAALVLAVATRSRPITIQIPSECSLTVHHNLVLPVKFKDKDKGSGNAGETLGGETP